jgi:hypothetical protein
MIILKPWLPHAYGARLRQIMNLHVEPHVQFFIFDITMLQYFFVPTQWASQFSNALMLYTSPTVVLHTQYLFPTTSQGLILALLHVSANCCSNHQESPVLKVKFRCGALFSTEAVSAYCTLAPKGVPSFISRGAARQAARTTSASEGRNYRWNLANNLVIHLSR